MNIVADPKARHKTRVERARKQGQNTTQNPNYFFHTKYNLYGSQKCSLTALDYLSKSHPIKLDEDEEVGEH